MFRSLSLRSTRCLRNTHIFNSRYASTLAFIETTSDGNISPPSMNLLSAAKMLKNDIVALLVGPNAELSAEKLKASVKCTELKKILIAKDQSLEKYLPENVAPLLQDILNNKEYTHFLISSSSIGKNIIPRVAALMDNQPVCDIVEIKDQSTFVRPIYAGNAFSVVKYNQPQKLISVRSSAFPVIDSGSSSPVEVEEYKFVPKDTATIEWVSSKLTETGRPDLGSAKIVVSGGRALKDKATFEKVLTPLANTLNAAIGATRAAVDSGLCDNSLQVGQTGKIVAPNLYFAIGLSGAVQHLAGMKDSGTIVAINNDPDAPIFKNADFGLEGDLFEIVPELNSKLQGVKK